MLSEASLNLGRKRKRDEHQKALEKLKASRLQKFDVKAREKWFIETERELGEVAAIFIDIAEETQVDADSEEDNRARKVLTSPSVAVNPGTNCDDRFPTMQSPQR